MIRKIIDINLNILYNILNALNSRYGLQQGKVSEDAYKRGLEALSVWNLSAMEAYAAENAANATWRACQPFRDITTAPLGRLSRSVNCQFNALPNNELEKDAVQLKAAAAFLLERISQL